MLYASLKSLLLIQIYNLFMKYIECNPMQRVCNLETVSIDNASINSVKAALFVIERINKLKLVRFLCLASILHIGERVESWTEL